MNNQKDFNREKEDYMEIKASDELRSKVANIFAESEKESDLQSKIIDLNEDTKVVRVSFMKSKTFRAVLGTAAAFTLVFTSALNIDKSFASRVAEIPGMDSVVKVLTFGRYTFDEGNISATVETPMVSGLVDESLQAKLNEEFKENASAVIAAFESEVLEMRKEYPQAYLGLDAGYEVVTNSSKYLAINLYELRTEGSAYEENRYITVDKENNRVIKLEDLYSKDSDYVNVISKYILGEMKAENGKDGKSYWIGKDEPDGFKKISKDQSFYINQKGETVISFNEGDVGPSSMGEVKFTIPANLVK